MKIFSLSNNDRGNYVFYQVLCKSGEELDFQSEIKVQTGQK